MTQHSHNASANVHFTRSVSRHNISNIICVPLTALKASADPTAIVCITVINAVCPSRKSTVCSSPCTIINYMSMATSAEHSSKAMKTIKHPRKVLQIAHINISILGNNVHEINNLLVTDDIHMLTTSETHLDNTFDDKVVAIHGYNIYRKDKNAKCGGVAIYIQNRIPVKLRNDLMFNTVEVMITGSSASPPILVGRCYRSPSANSPYLDNM